jgi:hypothetical protein
MMPVLGRREFSKQTIIFPSLDFSRERSEVWTSESVRRGTDTSLMSYHAIALVPCDSTHQFLLTATVCYTVFISGFPMCMQCRCARGVHGSVTVNQETVGLSNCRAGRIDTVVIRGSEVVNFDGKFGFTSDGCEKLSWLSAFDSLAAIIVAS